MSLLRRLFGLPEAAEPAGRGDADTLRRITDALEAMEPERARFLASFAFTLSRVAHADLHISAAETRAMEKILRERAGLPEEQAVLVVQIAKTQSRLFGSTDNYSITREFTRLADREQKKVLLECLFAVSAADDEVSVAEDNEIRRITEELKLDHGDFIAARSQWRDHLSVFRNRGAHSDDAGDA